LSLRNSSDGVNLLLAIREVDEVVQFAEEIVVCGTLQVVGLDAM
jgi:hypothetical protein